METSRTEALECIQCNKCSFYCPVHRADVRYSPRKTILQALLGRKTPRERDIWACLTCAQCREACPSQLDYPQLVKEVRERMRGRTPRENACKHGTLLETVQKIMAGGQTKQDRLCWLEEKDLISREGNIIYFTGCLPYLNDLFDHCDSLEIARSALKIFKAAGDQPLISGEERCCGHNLLWNGDRKNFEKLCRENYRWIRESKAERVVTTCAECYYILSKEYPKILGPLGQEVIHISDYIKENIEKGRLEFSQMNRLVTYQDSCRLSRYCEQYDAPRDVLRSIPGLKFKEMERIRENSICCGVGGYSSCDSYTKFIQHERLLEASAAAPVLVTSCPHCRIHFTCYLEGEPIEKIENLTIMDLATLVAEALE